MGEQATVKWVIGNPVNYLWGEEFTVLYSCSGMKKFFDSEYNINHVVQSLLAELLQCQLIILHRTEKMVWECDMLSKYNNYTEYWR